MSDKPASKPPVIPRPPPGGARRHKPPTDWRWLLWIAALGLGIGAGVGGYRVVKPLSNTFDYWLSRTFG